MTRRLEVDAHDRRQFVASGPDNGDVADIRTEFDPILDVVRNKAPARARPNNFADASKNHQLSIWLHVSGVAGVQPAVNDRLARRIRIVEITIDRGTGAHQNVAAVVDPHLDAWHRLADAMQRDLAFGLRGGQSCGFGLTVELPKINAE